MPDVQAGLRNRHILIESRTRMRLGVVLLVSAVSTYMTGCAAGRAYHNCDSVTIESIEITVRELAGTTSPAAMFENPRLREAILEHRNCTRLLASCLESSSLLLNAFAIHSFRWSESPKREDFIVAWLKGKGGAESVAVLELCLPIVEEYPYPVSVPVDVLSKVFASKSWLVRRGIVKALRTSGVVPYCENERDSFTYFEELLILGGWMASEGDPCELGDLQKVLEKLMSLHVYRDGVEVATIPQFDMKYVTTSAIQHASEYMDYVRGWWRSHRDYLVWIPYGYAKGESSQERILLQKLTRKNRLRGGFFLVDQDAIQLAVPTRNHRRSNPWKSREGPMFEGWYGMGGSQE